MAKAKARVAKKPAKLQQAESYQHPESESPMRPDVGTQAQFKKRKPPVTYRYDSSLSPALDWDGQNPAREAGERHLSVVLDELSVVRRQLSVDKPDLKAAAANLRKAEEAAQTLKALSKPFLNWAGKAERLSFDVPTLPLFVHERLSTKAIIETLSSHKRDKQQTMFELFGDPEHSITDQVLRAYEHRDKWVNRMILGDSLVVMNSLLQYEGLGGQVQMIYMDPPYGVKFGSNFQPFVRKRDVSHNDDDDMTREPEMVQAYRDTWELGLHSYLTYLRDRLLVARDLLSPSGSIFVQISDENVHHVREAMDEVFGPENFVSLIAFRKKTMPLGTVFLEQMADFLIWYAKKANEQSGKRLAKYNRLYSERSVEGEFHYCWYELPDGTRHRMSRYQLYDHALLPPGARVYRLKSLEPSGPMESGLYDYRLEGIVYKHPKNGYATPLDGMHRLVKARRIQAEGNRLTFIMYADEGTETQLTAPWTDTVGADDKSYVVQTNTEVLRRCVLMTTDPGDLVLDPTCGSGTTAYVAEQWGRRWITIDTSRVPLALARQRLLTATFPWYELTDEARGPVGGFVYQRKQNSKGEEVGGIVPHVTLKSIANNEPPEEEVLVDRPEKDHHITRVTGPFCVEGTIPTPVDLEDAVAPVSSRADGGGDTAATEYIDRMLEVLRKSPVLRLAGNRTVTLRSIRPPAKTLSLSAEALVEGNGPVAAGFSPANPDAALKGSATRTAAPVALVFGPENGAISERLVQESAKEASLKNYTHLYVVGFAIQPNARELIENCDAVVGIPATYVVASSDLTMGDLLKNMRSSQIFSVCGLPEIKIHRVGKGRDAASRKPAADANPKSQIPDSRGAGAGSQIPDAEFQKAAGAGSQIPDAESRKTAGAGSQIADAEYQSGQYQVELLGLDVFDPVTMDTHHAKGDDVPAWFLDTDYNGLCFHVSQAFFPRTSAWDNLKKALKGEYEESVWDHLAGTVSAAFEAGEHGQIAVKVIDDRGNELMVVEKLG